MSPWKCPVNTPAPSYLSQILRPLPQWSEVLSGHQDAREVDEHTALWFATLSSSNLMCTGPVARLPFSSSTAQGGAGGGWIGVISHAGLHRRSRGHDGSRMGRGVGLRKAAQSRSPTVQHPPTPAYWLEETGGLTDLAGQQCSPGGEYEGLHRVCSTAAPSSSRCPLPASCCHTPMCSRTMLVRLIGSRVH